MLRSKRLQEAKKPATEFNLKVRRISHLFNRSQFEELKGKECLIYEICSFVQPTAVVSANINTRFFKSLAYEVNIIYFYILLKDIIFIITISIMR